MGIKHFFSWFRKKFGTVITSIEQKTVLSDYDELKGVSIDNLMIDMNGLFHTSAQKVYQYGKFEPIKRLLGKRRPVTGLKKQLECFQDICNTMNSLIRIINPKKRVILCIDGPAPLSKQTQQRQRRYLSSLKKDEEKEEVISGDVSYLNRPFDSNCITPGTKFMDYLSKYIDWFIKREMSDETSPWSKLEVVFSNEKAPGEGEHKLVNYIRKHGNRDESYCIHGMDADLIMLSLATHVERFYILREEPHEEGFHYFIDIGQTRRELSAYLDWTKHPDLLTEEYAHLREKQCEFNTESGINDFVFACFTVGNDFLPHIPCIEIIEGGIDFMLDIYRVIGMQFGHLTERSDGRVVTERSDGRVVTERSDGRVVTERSDGRSERLVDSKRAENNTPESTLRFRPKPLAVFLKTISGYEKRFLEDKLEHKDEFFQDDILEKNTTVKEVKSTENTNPNQTQPKSTYDVDITGYRRDYHEINLQGVNKEKLCFDYLQGMYWVLNYYTRGVPNWKWRFLYHYAPFSNDLADALMNSDDAYDFSGYTKSTPTLPYLQLLCVLPPRSAHLLPEPLSSFLSNPNTPIMEFYPEKVKIDLSGKRQDWEGIVLLPFVKYEKIEKWYKDMEKSIPKADSHRNISGRSYIYSRGASSYHFRSFYGDISSCWVTQKIIDI